VINKSTVSRSVESQLTQNSDKVRLASPIHDAKWTLNQVMQGMDSPSFAGVFGRRPVAVQAR